jgi:hypothetical protein
LHANSSIRANSRFCALGILFASVLFLSACTTIRSGVASRPLDALGEGADVYLVIPVRANEDLVSSALVPLVGEASAAKLISRTEIAYFAAGNSAPAGKTARFVAMGSFPKSGAAVAFRESKGWTRIADPGLTWYRSSAVSVAIPARGVLCGLFSRSGMENDRRDLTDLASRTRSSGEAPVAVSPSFEAYSAIAVEDGRIGFFSGNPAIFVAALLGPDIDLPVRYLEGYASRLGDGDYSVSATITLSDARSARAIRPLLARVVRGASVTVEDDRVIISDYRVTREKIAGMAEFLYLEKK